eukprot:CAMPEP_0170261028 /NCGR_PEP_ID=MMETSP0116_2-20130129/30394_1 /TAXON_ID=400756 /ORGANISM="Durinskia baltica, Strain CSIRO CS-38" /LENGTH=381 /DNA_ID=CAMNT_0010512091 /DNA_START=38 /DNA_END=1181 /DNA_ORIENTATION=-
MCIGIQVCLAVCGSLLWPYVLLNRLADDGENSRPMDLDSTASDMPIGDPRRIRPLIWVHIPKCGSAFQTTLVHHACGVSVPENFSTLDPHENFPFKHMKIEPCAYSKRGMRPTTCEYNAACGDPATPFSEQPFGRFGVEHVVLWPPPSHMRHPGMAWYAIPNISDAYLRNVVCMFREPRQRVISQWNYILAVNHMGRRTYWQTKGLANFSKCISAVATQMILGIPIVERLGLSKCMPNLSKYMQPARAKRIVEWRVRQFGFVGLTDHWAITICLFHVMFGGGCVAAEFEQLRRGANRGASMYNTTEYGLDEFDSMDHDTYRVASEVFWSNVIKYGVHRKLCQQRVCPKAADSFEDLVDGQAAFEPRVQRPSLTQLAACMSR